MTMMPKNSLFLTCCVFIQLCVVGWTTAASDGGALCELKCRHKEKPFFPLSAVLDRSKPLFSSNGCGTEMIKVAAPQELVVCCHIHDACYSLCGISRETCESEFKACLNRQCRKSSDRQCGQQAIMLGAGAQMLGCGAFADAQKASCTCQTRPQREEVLQPLVRRLWEQTGAFVTDDDLKIHIQNANHGHVEYFMNHLRRNNETLIWYDGNPYYANTDL